ncbi:MAG: hypothetical protein K2W96_08170, partial [Gemmataceae bacterium]|nr:hypothetical protein [Gemmataceae bacterium]
MQDAPTLFQGSGEGRTLVEGRFVLLGDDQVGFEVGEYDRTRNLVIDPVLNQCQDETRSFASNSGSSSKTGQRR